MEFKMKDNRNFISLILVCALLLTVALGCMDKKKYTAQTSALIIRGGNNEVHFSYIVNDKNYQAKSKTDYAVMSGTLGKACYIPAEPEKAYFAFSNETCGK